MLNDEVINRLQDMLKTSYPHSKGLQNTLLGERYQFDITKAPFVQVLHNGNLHWLANSTVNCAEDEVVVMDSLFHGKLTEHTKRQICALINCKNDKIIVKVLPVQQQTNNIDCGLYAIAFL